MLRQARKVIKIMQTEPGYALMPVGARFRPVRRVVSSVRSLLQQRQWIDFIKFYEAKRSESLFQNVDPVKFAQELREKGLAFGLKLPPELVAEIRAFADQSTCYVDRDIDKGFFLSQREAAEKAVGKPILVAQYYNVCDCPSIEKLKNDPVLREIAARYMLSVPTFVGVNLWWTFPVKAREEDRIRHAHLYHRDIDDFRFFKFFFYLTDVSPNDSAHVAVVASHHVQPVLKSSDYWNIRRYTDEEINACYPKEDILEITGKAGDGFAENTLCLHKGSTPQKEARLLLQFQYALFDYGCQDDVRPRSALKMLF